MLSKPIQDALNEQIRNEMFSAYLYLSMSAYCEHANLPGTAHWLRVQSKEELGHAMKLFDYINDQGGRVLLAAIDQPQTEFASALDVFTQVLGHERQITGKINKLYELALAGSDYATQVELQWFIREQVEEEKTASRILDQLKMIDGHTGALIMLDRHLGSRENG